jgi:hypothetical protein
MENDLTDLEQNRNWKVMEHGVLEGLDTDLSQGMKQSEKQSERPDPAPWNPSVHKTYLVYSYWKKYWKR